MTMTMTTMSQATAAHNLLQSIRQRIVEGQGPLHGYAAAAAAAGYTTNAKDAGRAMGQVTSRIDLAAFYAGLPMLAVHWVRNPDGKINQASFPEGCWEQFKEEIETVSAAHVWTTEDIDKVLAKMHSVLDAKEGARSMWDHVERREMQKAGFIRHNLHRALRS